MAEPEIRARSALEGMMLPERLGLALVREAPEACRFSCRGAAEPLGTAVGVTMPGQPSRVETQNGRAALWLGPDEWLVLAPARDRSQLTENLRTSAAGGTCMAVDVSHRHVGLDITGRRASALLASGCPLDLDTSAFPVGMCTRTLLNKADIVLWRTAPDAFHIEVWRSFAPYVVGLLDEAMRDLD